jgi:hypothetical protein
LEHLDLKYNELTSIPQSLSSLRNLSFLELSGNNINGTVPAFLGDLTSSEITLDMSYNENLGGPIPTSFCNLANKNPHLDLYKTSFSCQPRCLLNANIGVSDLDVCGTNQTQETGFVVQSLFFGPGCEGGSFAAGIVFATSDALTCPPAPLYTFLTYIDVHDMSASALVSPTSITVKISATYVDEGGEYVMKYNLQEAKLDQCTAVPSRFQREPENIFSVESSSTWISFNPKSDAINPLMGYFDTVFPVIDNTRPALPSYYTLSFHKANVSQGFSSVPQAADHMGLTRFAYPSLPSGFAAKMSLLKN